MWGYVVRTASTGIKEAGCGAHFLPSRTHHPHTNKTNRHCANRHTRVSSSWSSIEALPSQSQPYFTDTLIIHRALLPHQLINQETEHHHSPDVSTCYFEDAGSPRTHLTSLACLHRLGASSLAQTAPVPAGDGDTRDHVDLAARAGSCERRSRRRRKRSDSLQTA